jgi:ADP-ribose pyrophosphatase YjhB (NUDIX family)
MPNENTPDIQLLANLVINDGKGKVLLTKYDGEDDKWWLPGAELVAYEHPDEAVVRALQDLGIHTESKASLHHLESFRGRRGWHVMFNYALSLNGSIQTDAAMAKWFDSASLPDMAHGAWEKTVITKALIKS